MNQPCSRETLRCSTYFLLSRPSQHAPLTHLLLHLLQRHALHVIEALLRRRWHKLGPPLAAGAAGAWAAGAEAAAATATPPAATAALGPKAAAGAKAAAAAALAKACLHSRWQRKSGRQSQAEQAAAHRKRPLQRA